MRLHIVEERTPVSIKNSWTLQVSSFEGEYGKIRETEIRILPTCWKKIRSEETVRADFIMRYSVIVIMQLIRESDDKSILR